jgi:radical SAM-linked protein
MPEPGLFRYRIRFAKTAPLRFIGHLDLHRAWERTLRRAGAPLAYSSGHNPRPRLNLGLALPLGCTSEGDLLDAYLESRWEPQALLSALRAAAPDGLEVESVDEIEPGAPTLQREISSCEYRVELEQSVDPAQISAAVRRLLEAESLPRQRRGRHYDLRPLVEGLELEGGQNGRPPMLVIRLAAREGATGRPEEVLLQLGLDPLALIPHRFRLLGPSD